MWALEASASYQNWVMPVNSFTPLAANDGYHTAYCYVTTTKSQGHVAIRIYSACICNAAHVGSAMLTDLIWAWLGKLALLHGCFISSWLQQTSPGVCFL